MINDKMPVIQAQIRELTGKKSDYAQEKKDELDAKRIAWRDELKIINKELTGKIPFGELPD